MSKSVDHALSFGALVFAFRGRLRRGFHGRMVASALDLRSGKSSALDEKRSKEVMHETGDSNRGDVVIGRQKTSASRPRQGLLAPKPEGGDLLRWLPRGGAELGTFISIAFRSSPSASFQINHHLKRGVTRCPDLHVKLHSTHLFQLIGLVSKRSASKGRSR